MAKDTFYFSHDYNARNDPKIKLLIKTHKFSGYGIYWAIIEDLYNNSNELPTDYKSIAFDLRTKEKLIKSIVEDFDLFIVKNNFFGSDSIQKRLEKRDSKSKNAQKSANKRWGKDANALPTQCEPDAIKDIKESKGKDIKESIITASQNLKFHFRLREVIYYEKISDFFKQNFQSFREQFEMKNGSDHTQEIYNRMDAEKNGYSFSNENHIQNTFTNYFTKIQNESKSKPHGYNERKTDLIELNKLSGQVLQGFELDENYPMPGE